MIMKKAFTLVEVLIVVASVSILATIVYVATNPAERFKAVDNLSDRRGLHDVGEAIHIYKIDNNGELPLYYGTSQMPTYPQWYIEYIYSFYGQQYNVCVGWPVNETTFPGLAPYISGDGLDAQGNPYYLIFLDEGSTYLCTYQIDEDIYHKVV